MLQRSHLRKVLQAQLRKWSETGKPLEGIDLRRTINAKDTQPSHRGKIHKVGRSYVLEVQSL